MFLRRITSQINQARVFFQTILDLVPQQSNQRIDLVQDKFGLHKMIVVVTSAGKVWVHAECRPWDISCYKLLYSELLQLYGIETRKGEIIWQLRLPNIRGFTKLSNTMILYVQRGSRHFPHPPQCALLAEDKVGCIYIQITLVFVFISYLTLLFTFTIGNRRGCYIYL